MAMALAFVGCQLNPVTRPEQRPNQPGPGQQPEQQTVVAAIEKVVKIQEGVAVALFSATDPDSPLDERLRAVAQKLTELPTVTDAVAGADTIRVSYASGLEGGLLYLPQGSTRRGPTGAQSSIHGFHIDDIDTVVEDSGEFLPATDVAPPPVVVNDNVLICAPLDNNVFEPQFAETGAAVANIFRNAKGRYLNSSEGAVRSPNFRVTYLDYTKCTLEQLQKMSDYGTIVFSGHGMWGSHLLLGYRVDSRTFASLSDGYLWNVTVNVINRAGIVTGTRTVTAITDHFVRHYIRNSQVGMNKGRIVFAAACTSTQDRTALVGDTDLVDAFNNNGSEDFYLGFDNNVDDQHADLTTRRFFQSMVVPGGESEASYTSIGNLVDPTRLLPPPSLGIPPPATLTRHAGVRLHTLRYSTPPSFGEPGTSGRAEIEDQSYRKNTAITPQTLPLALGFDGDLTYRIEPTVPGLTFHPVARMLSGAPTEEGTYEMTYVVSDTDRDESPADTDSLTFTITVHDDTTVSVPDSFVGWTFRSGCTSCVPHTTGVEDGKFYLHNFGPGHYCATGSYEKTGERTARIELVAPTGKGRCDVFSMSMSFEEERLRGTYIGSHTGCGDSFEFVGGNPHSFYLVRSEDAYFDRYDEECR